MNPDGAMGTERPSGATIEPSWSSVPSTVDKELVHRLFVAPERWGWEYLEPAPIKPYSQVAPVWQEPPPPDLSVLQQRLTDAADGLPLKFFGGIGLGLLGLVLISSTGFFGLLMLMIGIGLAAAGVAKKNSAQTSLDAAKAQAQARWDATHQQFLSAKRSWDEACAGHDRAELTRYNTVKLHYPLTLRGMPSRVDVVGGTPAGWAALLATMGSSALATGSPMLLLDLSGLDVASGLAQVSQERELPVRVGTLPADVERLGFLHGLEPDELAEVLAAAMASGRTQADQDDLVNLYSGLLEPVARNLDNPVTFARLAAGIEVLRSTYDAGSDGPLFNKEVQRIQAQAIDRSERVRDELRFISGQLDQLAREVRAGDSADHPPTLWSERGVTILRTEARKDRQKDLADRVLFHLVLNQLADRPRSAAEPMVVVVNPDHLGRSSLESMADRAVRARVRLVYLFKHLREDTQHLIGRGHGAVLIMKLGDQEATAAANFIGKGHELKLSQISRQLGRTVTDGGSTSTGEQQGHSRSEGSNDSRGPGGWVTGSSTTFTESWSKSWQEAKSWSTSDSQSDGVTYQRSYDFLVEPHEIQALEPTDFLLVDSHTGKRVVRAGTCFPGMVLVERVSDRPMLQ